MSLNIREAKAKHQKDLMAIPGVVSVGIGRDAEGNDLIIIGVDGRHPAEVKAIPGSVEGYPVQVKNVGTIKAE